MSKIINISQLREDLLNTYAQLKGGEIDHVQAKEFSNMAGKIISTLKVQIAYNDMTGSKNKIEFLENTI